MGVLAADTDGVLARTVRLGAGDTDYRVARQGNAVIDEDVPGIVVALLVQGRGDLAKSWMPEHVGHRHLKLGELIRLTGRR